MCFQLIYLISEISDEGSFDNYDPDDGSAYE